jgi:hypothetical protein
MKRGTFAKFDIEDALSKTTRDPSASLDLPVKAKKRKEIPAVSSAGCWMEQQLVAAQRSTDKQ